MGIITFPRAGFILTDTSCDVSTVLSCLFRLCSAKSSFVSDQSVCHMGLEISPDMEFVILASVMTADLRVTDVKGKEDFVILTMVMNCKCAFYGCEGEGINVSVKDVAC